MTAVVRGDALHIPLADKSVHLAITSPPYFALRSYRDDGDHYDGQIGSEPTPQAFLEALWAVTKELWRVLADDGSLFVNLGDKRSGSGGHNNSNLARATAHTEGIRPMPRPGASTRRNAPDRYNQAAFGRAKSKMLLPHRYAIGCEDGLADPDGVGWIVRQDMVWSKPNGLPESVTDRVRDSHEYWFHLTKSPRYFAAVDEVREAHTDKESVRAVNGDIGRMRQGPSGTNRGTEVGRTHDDGSSVTVFPPNPLGKLPGSVWSIPSEPLQVPDWLGVDHFAAFPQEWPRRLILGWSPSGICTACGEGRRPVVAKPGGSQGTAGNITAGRSANGSERNRLYRERIADGTEATITGYTCACPNTLAPTRPAVVLDPFGGTGTVAMVARALGRTGTSLDLSGDYCRLASWRIFESGQAAKTRDRTNREAQGQML